MYPYKMANDPMADPRDAAHMRQDVRGDASGTVLRGMAGGALVGGVAGSAYGRHVGERGAAKMVRQGHLMGSLSNLGSAGISALFGGNHRGGSGDMLVDMARGDARIYAADAARLHGTSGLLLGGTLGAAAGLAYANRDRFKSAAYDEGAHYALSLLQKEARGFGGFGPRQMLAHFGGQAINEYKNWLASFAEPPAFITDRIATAKEKLRGIRDAAKSVEAPAEPRNIELPSGSIHPWLAPRSHGGFTPEKRSSLKQAYEPSAQYAIENPYEYVQHGVGPHMWGGARLGAGIGAVGGAAYLGAMAGAGRRLPAAALGAVTMGLAGGALGGMLGRGAAVQENWDRHAEIVRQYEAEHGPLPYELRNPHELALLEEMKGQAAGMAVDTLASGNIYGIADRDRRGSRPSTYGAGRHMGGMIGEMSARQQFNRALADYKREQHAKS